MDFTRAFFRGLFCACAAALLFSEVAAASGGGDSRLSDEPIPLIEDMPETPAPLIEFGAPFLDTGPLSQGIELPTGAVWQPKFLMFGTLRSALQTFDDGSERRTEWVNRMDLFAQLSLSGTERILLGLRPLDKGRGRNSGYYFKPDDAEQSDWESEFNLKVDTLYFEGDFGELFPALDDHNRRALDIGFAVGRQPIFKQEGMLINDTIDALGVVRNSISIPGASNLRVSAIAAWNHVSRNDNKIDSSAKLFGLFGELDTPLSTVDLDLVYVSGDQPGWFGGISGVQRFGRLNTSLRALFSKAKEPDSAEVSDGYLLFGEFSFAPHGTDDNAYLNAFWAIDNYSSAARRRDSGGPLGRTGILFAAVGMGRYGAALGNRTNKSWGGSLGYQKFFAGGRRQVIVEAGGRFGSEDKVSDAVAAGARLQQAIGRHYVVRLDGFLGNRKEGGSTNGARAEFLVKF